MPQAVCHSVCPKQCASHTNCICRHLGSFSVRQRSGAHMSARSLASSSKRKIPASLQFLEWKRENWMRKLTFFVRFVLKYQGFWNYGVATELKVLEPLHWLTTALHWLTTALHWLTRPFFRVNHQRRQCLSFKGVPCGIFECYHSCVLPLNFITARAMNKWVRRFCADLIASFLGATSIGSILLTSQSRCGFSYSLVLTHACSHAASREHPS